mmetsp:Transcript_64913/g.174057  ORF Transcript_64913/g.174057 Transcript_64913/m.174057 type:complete len:394 (-) Transcript_64913:33-1214(-)
MQLAVLLGAAQAVTRDAGSTNISMAVTSAGEVSRTNTCGLPQSGTCAGDFEDCYTFETLYCPDWEGIALSGNCIIPNANQICCDEIPEPCRLGWEASGAEGMFCSKGVNCLRPSCHQEKFYLANMYWKKWCGSNNFGDCFFASAKRSTCEVQDANFGNASVGLSSMGQRKNGKKRNNAGAKFIQELADRAATEHQVGVHSLDRSTESKELPTEQSINGQSKDLEPVWLAEEHEEVQTLVPDDSRKLLTERSSLASTGTAQAEASVQDNKKKKDKKKDYDDDDDDDDDDYDDDYKDYDDDEEYDEYDYDDKKKKSRSNEPTPEAQSDELLRCSLLTERRQRCSKALEWRFATRNCEDCLEQGTVAPACDHTSIEAIMSDNKLDFFQKTYCRCIL